MSELTIQDIQQKQAQIKDLQQQIAYKKAIAAEKEQSMNAILAKYNVNSFEELQQLYESNLAVINQQAQQYDTYIHDTLAKLEQLS